MVPYIFVFCYSHVVDYHITGNFRIVNFTKILFLKKIFENDTCVLKNPIHSMLSHTSSNDTKIDTFWLYSVVCGHHIDYIFKNVWSSMVGKELECMSETWMSMTCTVGVCQDMNRNYWTAA